jgi:hypothetical protein
VGAVEYTRSFHEIVSLLHVKALFMQILIHYWEFVENMARCAPKQMRAGETPWDISSSNSRAYIHGTDTIRERKREQTAKSRFEDAVSNFCPLSVENIYSDG